MSSIQIARSGLPTLFSAPRLMLVARDLRALITQDIRTLYSVLEFEGMVIADDGGETVALQEMGLPANIAVVIDHKGGAFSRALGAMMGESKHPNPPAMLLLSRIELMMGSAQRRLSQVLGAELVADRAMDVGRITALEREVAVLRNEVERRDLRIGRLSGMLNMLNLADEELAIDIVPSDDMGAVSLPTSQPIQRTLRGLRQISVFKNSNGAARVSVDISIAGRSAFATVIDAEAGTGWLDIALPEAVVASVQNAQISFQSLAEPVTLAGAPKDRTVALRFWWERDENEATGSAATLFGAPAPVQLKGGDNGQIVMRGLLVPAGATLTLPGEAGGGGSGRGAALLVPHGTAASAEMVQAAMDGSTATTVAGKQQSIELTVKNSGPTGRYDVVVAGRGAKSAITWSQPRLEMADAVAPRAFASARFATLYSAISYCDGPLEELRLNGELGYPIVSISDGHPYLQTHPVPGKIVGARIADIIPIGTERIWLDIANVHPKADTIEFIAAVLPDIEERGVEEWLDALQLPAYADYAVTDLDNGGLLARVSMAPGTYRTLDLQLRAPLDRQGQLYCLVNCIGASNRFGWCRWNAMALSLDAHHPVLPISP